MEKWIIISLLILCRQVHAQGNDPGMPVLEDELERQAERDENALDDDLYVQHREALKSAPLELNTATETDLKDLFLLSPIQISHFLRYRQLLGKLVALQELQAIPGWDLPLIRKLLPFIRIGPDLESFPRLREWPKGDHAILIRSAMALEKTKGFQSAGGARYLGSRPSLYVRYSYQLGNVLQYGLKADKDAGEPLFSGQRPSGFDFYSFYLSIRQKGILKSLVIGDFTVNLGQGLIQWQSLAFKKSADLANLKRQAAVLRPYTSSGESNFHRGAGAVLTKGKWEAGAFVSWRKISANTDVDSADHMKYISSINLLGYHRTPAEMAARNNVAQLAVGGTVRYATPRGHIAINGVQYQFSRRFKKKQEPYQVFYPEGNRFGNASIDYSLTYRNIHFFGEAARDIKGRKALLNGILVSAAPHIDLSLVQRTIDKGYYSFYSNALTESASVTNETGFYAGVSVRPFSFLAIDAFKDAYRFPWLRYRVHAPSGGSEYFFRLSYNPDRRTGIYARFSHERKAVNLTSDDPLPATGSFIRQKLRVHAEIAADRQTSLASRWELGWYEPERSTKEQGWLFYQDTLYKSPSRPWSCGLRLTLFETSSYNSRIYAFESGGGGGFTMPAYYGKGYQYRVNLHFDLGKPFGMRRGSKWKTRCWIYISRGMYPENVARGTAVNGIPGGKKTLISAQIQVIF